MLCGKKDLPSCLSLSWRVLGGFKLCLGEGSVFRVLLPGALPAPSSCFCPGRFSGEAECPSSGGWEQL